MARITVDDCLKKIDNRYQLVLAASTRARQLVTGEKDPLISEDEIGDNKCGVIALREIAKGEVTPEFLQSYKQELIDKEVEVSQDDLDAKFEDLDRAEAEQRAKEEKEAEETAARNKKRKELQAQKEMENSMLADVGNELEAEDEELDESEDDITDSDNLEQNQ